VVNGAIGRKNLPRKAESQEEVIGLTISMNILKHRYKMKQTVDLDFLY